MATTRRATAKATTKAAKATTKTTKATRARRRGATTPVTQRICNLVPSRDTERDWQLADAVDAGIWPPLPHPRPLSTFASHGGRSATRRTPARASAGPWPKA